MFNLLFKRFKLIPMSKKIELLEEELRLAKVNTKHWKSNHDHVVKACSVIRDRPDLGDRAKKVCYLIKENEELRNRLVLKDQDINDLNTRLIERRKDMMETIVKLSNELMKLKEEKRKQDERQ